MRVVAAAERGGQRLAPRPHPRHAPLAPVAARRPLAEARPRRAPDVSLRAAVRPRDGWRPRRRLLRRLGGAQRRPAGRLAGGRPAGRRRVRRVAPLDGLHVPPADGAGKLAALGRELPAPPQATRFARELLVRRRALLLLRWPAALCAALAHALAAACRVRHRARLQAAPVVNRYGARLQAAAVVTDTGHGFKLFRS